MQPLLTGFQARSSARDASSGGSCKPCSADRFTAARASRAGRWVAAVLGSLICGCTETPSEATTGSPYTLNVPRISMRIEPGTISEIAPFNEATVVVSSTTPGEVRLAVGEGCASGSVPLREPRSLAPSEPITFTLSTADAALQATGLYRIHACFADAQNQTARASGTLRVDSSPPQLSISPPPGTYCDVQAIEIYCPDCQSIAYSINSDAAGVSPAGEVTGGTRYDGQPILIAEPSTLYVAAVDAAGNELAEPGVVYDVIRPGPLGSLAATDTVISANTSSSQDRTELTFESSGGRTYTVRRGGESCGSGVEVATGTTQTGGTTALTVQAAQLALGPQSLRVCIETDAGRCYARVGSVGVTRKDASEGWAPPDLSLNGVNPRDLAVSFEYEDPQVETGQVDAIQLQFFDPINDTWRNVQGYGFNWSVGQEGVQVSFDEAALPEGAYTLIQLQVSNFYDAAGNPLPTRTTGIFTTGYTDLWYPPADGDYEQSGDVVFDASTGLHWQRCRMSGDGSACPGPIGGGEFVGADQHGWFDAVTACANLSLGGYSDWRLPHLAEFLSLADPSRLTGFASVFEQVDFQGFWTATVNPNTDEQAFAITDEVIAPFAESLSQLRNVRCVRGRGNPQPRSAQRVRWDGGEFVPDPQGPIVDVNGVYWEQQSQNGYSFSQAEARCRGELHGVGGWALPTGGDWASLFDIASQRYPFSNGQAFDYTTAATYWIDSNAPTSGNRRAALYPSFGVWLADQTSAESVVCVKHAFSP